MTCNVLIGTLNPTHSLTCSLLHLFNTSATNDVNTIQLKTKRYQYQMTEQQIKNIKATCVTLGRMSLVLGKVVAQEMQLQHCAYCYVDYEQAFDRVDSTRLMMILQNVGVD